MTAAVLPPIKPSTAVEACVAIDVLHVALAPLGPDSDATGVIEAMLSDLREQRDALLGAD